MAPAVRGMLVGMHPPGKPNPMGQQLPNDPDDGNALAGVFYAVLAEAMALCGNLR